MAERIGTVGIVIILAIVFGAGLYLGRLTRTDTAIGTMCKIERTTTTAPDGTKIIKEIQTSDPVKLGSDKKNYSLGILYSPTHLITQDPRPSEIQLGRRIVLDLWGHIGYNIDSNSWLLGGSWQW